MPAAYPSSRPALVRSLVIAVFPIDMRGHHHLAKVPRGSRLGPSHWPERHADTAVALASVFPATRRTPTLPTDGGGDLSPTSAAKSPGTRCVRASDVRRRRRALLAQQSPASWPPSHWRFPRPHPSRRASDASVCCPGAVRCGRQGRLPWEGVVRALSGGLRPSTHRRTSSHGSASFRNVSFGVGSDLPPAAAGRVEARTASPVTESSTPRVARAPARTKASAPAIPSDQAADRYVDGFGGGYDDGVRQPHGYLVEEIPGAAGEAQLARRRLGQPCQSTGCSTFPSGSAPKWYVPARDPSHPNPCG